MKYSYFLKASFILIISLLPTLGFSQSRVERGVSSKFSFGLKAGASYTDLGGPDKNVYVNGDYKYHFGFFLETSLSERLRFQPELVYSKQGGSGDNIGRGYDIEINYLNIPLMLKYTPLDTKFYVDIGPQIGLLLSNNTSMYIGSAHNYEDIKGMDFSVGLGMGFDFHAWGIGARFNKGLSDITELADWKVRNSVLQLSLYYSIL